MPTTKRQFSDEERYAVYTVHGERCYMCGKPVDLTSMEVDHVIPESLLDKPEALADVLKAFGLPPEFDLQSFANWLPSCGPCNNRKRNRVFNASPIIQTQLQIAAEKAAAAAELVIQRVSARAVSRAWNTIKRAHNAGNLSEPVLDAIKEFVSFHVQHRVPEAASTPIQLAPAISVISEKDGIRLVKGPYGVGGGPVGPYIDPSFYCPNCGSVAWSGARCVVCGEMSED